MNTTLRISAQAALIAFSVAAAGCGSTNLIPFMGDKQVERSRVPANSLTYQCAGGKRFYLRYLDNGAAAWVILPEREFRLDRVLNETSKYGNGKALLSVGEETSLVDGPTVNYAGCRIPSAAPPKPEAAEKK